MKRIFFACCCLGFCVPLLGMFPNENQNDCTKTRKMEIFQNNCIKSQREDPVMNSCGSTDIMRNSCERNRREHFFLNPYESADVITNQMKNSVMGPHEMGIINVMKFQGLTDAFKKDVRLHATLKENKCLWKDNEKLSFEKVNLQKQNDKLKKDLGDKKFKHDQKNEKDINKLIKVNDVLISALRESKSKNLNLLLQYKRSENDLKKKIEENNGWMIKCKDTETALEKMNNESQKLAKLYTGQIIEGGIRALNVVAEKVVGLENEVNNLKRENESIKNVFFELTKKGYINVDSQGNILPAEQSSLTRGYSNPRLPEIVSKQLLKEQCEFSLDKLTYVGEGDSAQRVANGKGKFSKKGGIFSVEGRFVDNSLDLTNGSLFSRGTDKIEYQLDGELAEGLDYLNFLTLSDIEKIKSSSFENNELKAYSEKYKKGYIFRKDWVYKGLLKKGEKDVIKPNGKGLRIFSDGVVENGLFDNGNFVSTKKQF